MEAIDNGHKYSKVSAHYGIPKSSIRDHMNGRTKTRKMGPKGVLSEEEEIALCTYIEDMAECGLPLIPSQIKIKVGQMTQGRMTSFKNGIPGASWWKWFRRRHPELSMRTLQGRE